LREARQLDALDRRLPALGGGQEQPRGAAECLLLAGLCQRPDRQLYASSARYYAEAFAEQPNLAADLPQKRRYSAACAAARAGTGQGKDVKALGEEGKARLRRQALGWLRADLAAWGQLLARGPAQAKVVQSVLTHWLRADPAAWGQALAKGPAQAKEPARAKVVRITLTRWQKDADLAGVRDEKELAKLPAEEQQAWRKLWADVDALLRQARSAK
jgi:hypothetical protein